MFSLPWTSCHLKLSNAYGRRRRGCSFAWPICKAPTRYFSLKCEHANWLHWMQHSRSSLLWLHALFVGRLIIYAFDLAHKKTRPLKLWIIVDFLPRLFDFFRQWNCLRQLDSNMNHSNYNSSQSFISRIIKGRNLIHEKLDDWRLSNTLSLTQ